MSGRGWLNLGLALALAALGALAWFKPGTKDPAAEHPPAFPGAKAARALEVTLADGSGYALARGADGAWTLAKPFAAPADAALVGALLDQLAETTVMDRFPAASAAADALGFAKPTLTLALDGHRFVFGGVEPINYRRYVRDGDSVLLVGDLAYFQLNQSGAGLADKRLLPSGARIARVELPGRTLARDASGKWRLTPEDPRIAADAIAALVDAWARAAATEVKPLGEGALQGTVRIQVEGGKAPLAFELLTAAEGLRLARRDLGLEYRLPADARAALLELAPAPVAGPPAAPHK